MIEGLTRTRNFQKKKLFSCCPFDEVEEIITSLHLNSFSSLLRCLHADLIRSFLYALIFGILNQDCGTYQINCVFMSVKLIIIHLIATIIIITLFSLFSGACSWPEIDKRNLKKCVQNLALYTQHVHNIYIFMPLSTNQLQNYL